jgi:ABC-type uncharacterized transport system substrate-binding protein
MYLARLTARLACILVAVVTTAASAARIDVVVSDESAPYLEAANAFTETLARSGERAPKVTVLAAAELRGAKADALDDSSLVVTIGAIAAHAVLERHGSYPVLSIVIPKSTFESLHCEATSLERQRCSAIYLDQPLARQLNLIRAALPARRHLGVVLGPTSGEALPELREEAAQRKLSLASRVISDSSQLYPALQAVLSDSDLLLAMPDGVVLTVASARSVLVSAYRFQVPVIAFSESYVKAGALLALYSTPEQVGRQAAELVVAGLQGGVAPLPQPQYPKYFSVGVNEQVARSLGIRIADEKALWSQIGGDRE